ncbi:hypothetical protein WA026_020642 [Henosepilachna vigintioctopunctata]|uniref:Uncharacterized protein n=1 Tax=Henosepilachna vigintioctopunctata TaxID=420089 RepID=A0AAW1U4W3_9CUCU
MSDESNSVPTANSCDSCPPSPSSISSGELIPITTEEADNCNVFNYTDQCSLSAVTLSVLSNDLENLKRLVLQGNSLRVVDNNGDTPLHHAVRMFTPENMDILKYLLSIEDIDLEATNHTGMTPLLTAVKNMNEIAGLLLIEAGADSNMASSEYTTPLHYSAKFSSKLSEALILRGAEINAIDANMDTPLHCAISTNSFEVVPMLLYYNADTNLRNADGLTPFMLSLTYGYTELADELFEYVTDFNLVSCHNRSTLQCAILRNYPRIKEMIERGADVNYGSDNDLFLDGHPIEIDTFRYVWKHFNYECRLRKYKPHILISVLSNVLYSNDYKLQAVDIILCCENTNKMLNLTQESENYPLIHPVVNRLYKMRVSQEEAHKYCAILLSYGLKVYDIDLDMVYERFGYCELFKLLLQMPIYRSGFRKCNIFPYIIYQTLGDFNFFKKELDHRFETSHFHSFDNIDYENLLNHTVNFQLLRWFELEGIDPVCYEIHKYVSDFPVVPKLQELAIYKTRDFIRIRYKIKSCRQFYTTLKYLHIPNSIKQLIAFEIPLYNKYGSNALYIKNWINENREEFLNGLDDEYLRRSFPSDYGELEC